MKTRWVTKTVNDRRNFNHTYLEVLEVFAVFAFFTGLYESEGGQPLARISHQVS